MKWFAIVVLLGLTAVYVLVAGFGMVMSAFCFDSGTEAASWQCFAGINLISIVPSLICVVAGLVLLIMRRYKWSIAIAALPAVFVAVAYIVVFLANVF